MTALEIANLALLKLKAPSISSFNDSGYVAALIRNYLVFISDQIALERNWSFAKKRAELTENTSVTNNTEYDYVYDLPSDSLYPRSLKSGEKYEIEGGYLYTNDDSPVLIYTSHLMEMADTDEDPSTDDVPQLISGISLPPLVEDAIAATLAAELAPKITESTQLQAQLAQFAAGSLRRAKQHDAMMSPGGDEEPGWWADV